MGDVRKTVECSLTDIIDISEKISRNEPYREKRTTMYICATSEDIDQPDQLSSLTSICAVPIEKD